jgi:hypothetical protein
MMRRLALAMGMLLAATPALAWGEFAHRLTARLAAAELTPAARVQVRQLIAAAPRLNTPECRLASLEDASVWPDCVRGLGTRFAPTAPWHYQNISVCGDFDIAAKCPDGNCVTAQIPRQQAILANRALPAVQRLAALAYLVHFTGDLHQPLHVGDKGDRGGNDVRAAFGAIAGPRMNLHRIWDSELAERAATEPPALAPGQASAAQRSAWRAGGPGTAARVQQWAQESWMVAHDLVYPRLDGFPDTCAGPIGLVATVTPAYVAAATPVVRIRLAQAGSRIALLLNQALAPPGRRR